MQNQKFVLELEKEILKLEKQVNNADWINFKNKEIMKLKIFGKFLHLIFPYLISAGIIAGIFKFLDLGLPFYNNDIFKKYSHVLKEYDSNGNIRIEQQYADFESEDNLLTYYDKWVLQDDGLYQRKIISYDVDSLDEQQLLEVIKNYEDIVSLEEVFTKSSTRIETTNNLNLVSQNSEAYVQALIYDIDKDNYIFLRETSDENMAISILYVLLLIITIIFISPGRKAVSSFDFFKSVNQLKEDYQSIDVAYLTKILQIKKDNYNRLIK